MFTVYYTNCKWKEKDMKYFSMYKEVAFNTYKEAKEYVDKVYSYTVEGMIFDEMENVVYKF